MAYTTLDWFGIIGLSITIGGVVVAAIFAWRMKKPEADKTNAETIKTLFQQVNDSFQQIQLLQKQQMESRKIIDDLQNAPVQIYELTSRMQVRFAPKPNIESHEATIERVDITHAE